MSTEPTPVRRVAVVGGGIAAALASAQASRALPGDVELLHVPTETGGAHDALYGGVLPPEIYALHTSLGLGEPDLLLGSNAAFAFGTRITQWSEDERAWVQPFHLPLPALDGVPVHLRTAQPGQAVDLQDVLVSAAAIRLGRFAHPPQGQDHPLSRAEYGYLVDMTEMARLYGELADLSPTAPLADVTFGEAGVEALGLADGTTLTADLFIDASGPDAVLNPEASHDGELRYGIDQTRSASAEAPPAARIRGTRTGWAMQWQTRTVTHTLTVGEGERIVSRRRQAAPWQGNVVAVGQAACTLEPLTVAPVRLLMRDVARVAELFPVSTDMAVERRTFNAQAKDTQNLALAFHAAHFSGLAFASDYAAHWTRWSTPELDRKLRQYEARGVLPAFDRETFHPLDWAVLHAGVGRSPARADTLAAQADPAAVDAALRGMAQSIEAAVPKIPPHGVYLGKLLDYLARKHMEVRHVG